MKKNELIEKLSKCLEEYKTYKTIFVAIDGVDTSGKTTLADELKENIKKRKIYRVSIDGFHNDKKIRLSKGEYSPEGYYEDSFKYESIIENVFNPIINGKKRIIPKIFDYRNNEETIKEIINIPDKSVIIFDGVFLLRNEIQDYWDLSIFLEISFNEVIKRALKRDIEYFEDEKLLLKKYKERYIPGQKLYFEREKPKLRADIIIDNNDFDNPEILETKKFKPDLGSAVRSG